MEWSLLFKGIVLGLSIAAPVGPIGVLCIRRTLAEGRVIGFASGLGAATADALYGSVAAFGLTTISGALLGQRMWLGVLGGLFLLYLGARTFIAPPAERSAADTARGRGWLGAYASTLTLTLTNPMTILSFVAIFAGLGLGRAVDNFALAAWLVAGVFLGSALWWLMLSAGVGLLRARFDTKAMRWVNRLSGGVIFVFGGIALFGAR